MSFPGDVFGVKSQWHGEVERMCQYFVDKCENWDNSYYPDTWEEQPYPGQKEEIEELFRRFGEFVDVYSVLSAVDLDRDILKAAAEALNKDDLDAAFHDVDRQVIEWEGDTAESFSEYLRGTVDGGGGSSGQRPGMELALVKCRDRVTAANYSLKAYRDAVNGFKKDVEKLVKNAKDSIEEDAEAGVDNAISAVTAVVAVGAAAATAGSSLLAATAAVGSVLSSSVSASSGYELTGTDPFSIMMSMQESGEDILRDAQEALAQVARSFETVTDHLSGGHRLEVCPEQPGLVTDDRYDPAEFNPGRIPEKGISRDDLVKTPDA